MHHSQGPSDRTVELVERLAVQLERLCSDTVEELDELHWRWHHLETELERGWRRLEAPADQALGTARSLVHEIARGCSELRQVAKGSPWARRRGGPQRS